MPHSREQIARLIKRKDALKLERANFETLWDEVTKYVHPARGDFIGSTAAGTRRTNFIFDSTPGWSAEQLASALQSFLTPPEEPWMDLITKNPNLRDDEDVLFWLQDSTERMRMVWNSSTSNFNNQMHEGYMDLVSFGTAVLYEEFAGTNTRYSTRHLGEITIAENSIGFVDTIFRDFQLTRRQLMQEFGEANVSDKTAKLVKDQKNMDEKVDVLHVIMPRRDFERDSLGPKRFPIMSVYLELAEKHELREGGFVRMPFKVYRWSKLTGEVYGRSPATLALPDIKMLNEMMKTTIKAAQKSVDPPLMVPDDGFLNPPRTTPSGLNYYRSGTNDRIEALDTRADIGLGLEMIQQVRNQIMKAFFVDMLSLPDRPKSHQEMTATEILQRRDDRMLILAPMLARFQVELLGPVVTDLFNDMLDTGDFLPLPEQLADAPLIIDYISPIARAQKGLQGQALTRLMEGSAALIQFNPAVVDNLDTDETFRWLAQLNNFPQKNMTPKADVSTLRAERAQQEQQQQALLEGESVSGSLKNVAQAQEALVRHEGS